MPNIEAVEEGVSKPAGLKQFEPKFMKIGVLTAGLATVDPEIDLDLVRERPREGDFRAALSHSFGFGGSNAVLCLRRAAA